MQRDLLLSVRSTFSETYFLWSEYLTSGLSVTTGTSPTASNAPTPENSAGEKPSRCSQQVSTSGREAGANITLPVALVSPGSRLNNALCELPPETVSLSPSRDPPYAAHVFSHLACDASTAL